MKKISLVALGLMAGLTVSAQPDVLKNVEKLVKSKHYEEALQAIQPALTNPETAECPDAWFLAGKASEGIWDNGEIASITPGNQVTAADKAKYAKALLDAYNYMEKVLSFAGNPDIKGKPFKKTKDVMKSIGENYPKYQTAGLDLYNAQNYADAYKVWDIYTNLPENPSADKGAFKAHPDTVVGEICYYQSLAAYFNKDMKNAVNCVNRALDKGFSSKNVFIVGMDAANQLDDQVTANKFAKEGNKVYGGDDISFAATLINAELQKENYPACYEVIEESFAVAKNDSIKSSLYNVKAIINEREDKTDEALANLEQSIKLFPTNAKSYYDMGRLVQNSVASKEDNADEATRNNVLIPEILKAISFYEKSYELNPDQSEIPGHIYRLYYALANNYHAGDEYSAKAEEWKNKQ